MGGQRYITGAGYTWILEPEEAFGELIDVYAEHVRLRIVAIADTYAPLIEEWMIDNGAWQNITGLARDELHAEVRDVAGDMVELIFGHGVHYGLFLELNYGGRYAIVNPALDHFAPQIFNSVKRMLGR